MKVPLSTDFVQSGEAPTSTIPHDLQRSPWLVILPRLSRRGKDRFAKRSMILLTTAIWLLIPLLIISLVVRARPIILNQHLTNLLFSTAWHPLKGEFGFLPFILSTLWVTAVAMIVSIPLSLLMALYLAEYAHPGLRTLIMPVIDLLAGLPSVIYGVWGMLTVVPFIQNFLLPTLSDWFGFIPLFSSDNPTGFGILAGGLVLAVMVFPITVSISEEVIRSVPNGLREASLCLGATRWQTTKLVVLKRARSGVMAAMVLGFSRAFGETMAVLMVVGNVVQIPHSIFDAAYPLTALIANNFGEMMSIPLYDSALMTAALILLIVVLVFNLASRLILMRLAQYG